MSPLDTTPDHPPEPDESVGRADRDLPAALAGMANETRHGAAAPRRGHRVVLAQDLVDELALRYGHSPGAAAWAVHQAVRRGLLSAEMGVAVERPVVGWRPDENSSVVRARGLYGSHADHPGRQVPVYGAEVRRPLAPSDRPVPFTCLLVRSTDALWEGRAGRAAGPSDARPGGVAELLDWCERQVDVLAARMRDGGPHAAHYDLEIHQVGRQADALARAFCPPELVLSLPVVPTTYPHMYDHHKALTVLHAVSEWCRRRLAGAEARPAPETGGDSARPAGVEPPPPAGRTAGADPAGAAAPPRRPTRRGRRDPRQEARDAWVYRQCCKGRAMPYDKIVAALKRLAADKGWQIVSSKERIRQIGREYAARHGKSPPPDRQNL